MEPIDTVVEKLRDMDFAELGRRVFEAICGAARKLGRAVTRQVLCLYFVLKEGALTPKERAWVYAAIIYVVVPGDLLPRRVFHLIGLTDDLAAVAFVMKKVQKYVTPEILLKVDMQLDKWFGYEIL